MNDNTIESTAIVVREEPAPQAGLALFSGEPDEVIARAVKVADALKKVIESKGLVKRIQGREFVEVAGWQTVATMVGVTAFCEWTRPLEDGWEARVVVKRNGVDIGAAEAQCTKNERAWASRDGYALRSMAQTRATSKALRSVLGFIVVLAGYADTPAEEVPKEGFDDAKHRPAPPQDDSADRARGQKAVAALCREKGISDDTRHAEAEAMFGEPSMKNLSYGDLRALYKRLKELAG